MGEIKNPIKVRVTYFTEFGSKVTVMKLDELTAFINKFKIINIEENN